MIVSVYDRLTPCEKLTADAFYSLGLFFVTWDPADLWRFYRASSLALWPISPSAETLAEVYGEG